MKSPAILTLALGIVLCGAAMADSDRRTRMGTDEGKTIYVQLIVKACRAVVTPLEPTNHGKVYDDQKPMTAAERKAAIASAGCIDIPVPMEFLAEGMSPNACLGRGGFLAAMQFLEQRQDLREFSAVGSWHCVITDHEVIGPTTM